MMKQTALFFLVVFGGALSMAQGAPRGADWLLNDAYEEEYIPLSQVAVTMPADVRTALDDYASGHFRKTVEVLERMRALTLPDGRLDFVTFVLAESYRKLGCEDLARRDYYYVLKNFPSSDKDAPSLFRLMEFAVKNDNYESADSIYTAFDARFRSHPLRNAVSYLGALSNYRRKEYDKAIPKLLQIAPSSSRAVQGQFLSALCYLQIKDFPKALFAFAALREKVKSGDIADEAVIMIGDVYFMQNNAAAALDYYKRVPSSAKRYPYALLKKARCFLELGHYPECVKIAQNFIHDNRNSQYYFEMASVLEQGYAKLGNKKGAAEVNGLISDQIVNARLAFEIYDEINRVTDILQSWKVIENRAIHDGAKPLQDQAVDNIKRLQDLNKKYYAALRDVAPAGVSSSREVPYQAERRYLGILRTQKGQYGDTLGNVRKRLDSIAARQRSAPDDTGLARKVDSVRQVIDTLKTRTGQYAHEYELVLKECIGNDYGKREADEELQAKFVDWVFEKYQDNKELLKSMNTQLAARKKSAKTAGAQKTAVPSSKAGETKTPVKGEKEYSETDRDNLLRQIADDRAHLAAHIKTILDVYPKNAYNPPIMFRLAELYFDKAGDEFETALKAYEQKMAQGKDTAGLEFPEYKLDSVIATYDAIIDNYPHGDITDAAYFYKALALQKLGKEEESNKVLLTLIGKYPQSEYYVEANMNIGRYYFDHPKVENNTGYRLAEEAYRRVLFYRDHPQYVSALYQLGWCYYMQDRYDDAIAVFKYLVEGSHLDFDPLKMDEKQVSNPLLRGEAIDYIAISFDAENRIDTAIQFLKLVGNSDYAAIVLKRIGELREEDLDFNAAIRVYKRLLAEYPKSREAPRTYVSLIKLYEGRDKLDSAQLLREEFLAKYTRGGEWQKGIADSALLQTVDSMAISNGLYVADQAYRHADSLKSRDEYGRAARNYQRLVESYPGDRRAAEALWNLAVILDLKLLDKPQAYDRYIAFSRLTEMDSIRREQAALNAIAIAQGLLPTDSAVQKGAMEFAATKMVDAVNNYAELFPQGKSWGKVMLGLGALYFNRRLFTNAEKVYERIAERGPAAAGEYYEALSFLGQCYYGEENWPGAISAFEKIWKNAPDQAQRSAAYKLLLQSEFLNAKRFQSSGDFANAAQLFEGIDDKYPKSEYGDIALFNAAEAYEKLQQWDKACDRYADLVKRYPDSKLAADALFNAAGNFEKNNKFDKAAAAYETIAQNYPYSDKAKDALFNVGFCYEKLGKPDKMADANERYSSRYPGEKDVEAMMLRSAAFYAKAKMWERATTVYRNFINRFPRSAKAVEAYFMIAKCAYDQDEKEGALAGFVQTEQVNMDLAKAKLQSDNFYAAEAAYYTGMIKRDKFLAVKLVLPDDRMKKALKEKSDLLADAAKAFQRVMQYRSERMFEAAYRVGQLYEDLSAAWKDQERPSLEPIKAALLDKDIFMLSSGLLQKSFIPYQKTLEMAKGFDSLGAEQKIWVLKSENSLKKDFIDAGDLQLEGVSAMSSAPVPKEIREKPLFYYQYLKQVLEALAPLKEQVRQYYTSIITLSDSLGLAGEEIDTCRSKYAYVNYFIGEGYDRLAAQILRNSKEAAKDLPQDQREDLIFQLEDIVYEVQDKAIFAYEDGWGRIKKANLLANSWARQIIQSLARLSPEKYGAAYYSRTTIVSDGAWIVREDSVADWNSVEPPRQGWRRADTLPSVNPLALRLGTSRYVWGSADAPRAYLWKNVFLAGTPRSASMYVSTAGMYRLFVNGTLILSDTVGNRKREKIDSATGIVTVLKGGDNSIAAEIRPSDPSEVGAALLFSAMIDTSEHYKPSVKLPAAAVAVPAPVVAPKPETAPANERPAARDTVGGQPQLQHKETGGAKPAATPSYVTKYRNRGELLLAIDTYNNREIELNKEIKRENVAIQAAEIERDNLDAQLNTIRAAVDSLKARISGMSRKKEDVVKEKPVPATTVDTSKTIIVPKSTNPDTAVKKSVPSPKDTSKSVAPKVAVDTTAKKPAPTTKDTSLKH